MLIRRLLYSYVQIYELQVKLVYSSTRIYKLEGKAFFYFEVFSVPGMLAKRKCR